jgi:hypothetical protein
VPLASGPTLRSGRQGPRANRGEIAKRQAANHQRKHAAKAAEIAAKASAAGIQIAEMKERIRTNKAAARAAEKTADRRRGLMNDAQILLAEAKWRGAVLADADCKVLQPATSRKGFLSVGKEAIVAAIKRVGDAIHVLAVANARQILKAALGGKQMLQ